MCVPMYMYMLIEIGKVGMLHFKWHTMCFACIYKVADFKNLITIRLTIKTLFRVNFLVVFFQSYMHEYKLSFSTGNTKK